MIAMSFTEMNLADLILLERLRVDRLRNFFAESLLKCIIYVDHHNLLTIHCPDPWIVDTLLTDIEDLCDYAWLILGVEAISLFLAKEEIFHVGHCRFNQIP